VFDIVWVHVYPGGGRLPSSSSGQTFANLCRTLTPTSVKILQRNKRCNIIQDFAVPVAPSMVNSKNMSSKGNSTKLGCH
jgi:hypothetical protein